jgi:hypothetical protein
MIGPCCDPTRRGLSSICDADEGGIAIALGAKVGVTLRWKGEQLDRLIDAAHAAIVDTHLAGIWPVRAARERNIHLAGMWPLRSARTREARG